MNPYIKIRRELHEIPELGFQEIKTQKYLLTYLATLPQERLEIKTWRTGILAMVKGLNPTKRIGYRTDIDALPMSEQTELAFTSKHEEAMHACGHDFHMSIALGVLTNLVEQPVEDDILFIFQPAEEGPGGALPLMESGEFKAWKPDEVYALHVAPNLPVGTIGSKSGIFFAHTCEFFIHFKGKGGHAAFPHLTKDMVVASSAFIQQVQSVIARNINPLDAAVVTFGSLHAGSANNIIAEEAKLSGTARTFSAETMETVKHRVGQLAKGISEGYECEVTVTHGSQYYGVFNHKEQTEKLEAFMRENDFEVIEYPPAMTGEDFGYMLKEIPGCMFWLGVNSEYGLHHAKFNPDESAIPQAINGLTKFFQKNK